MPRAWSYGSRMQINKGNNLETRSGRDKGEPVSQSPESDSPQIGKHRVRNETVLEKP